MKRAAKGVVAGLCLCYVFSLLCQWASASPVETRCVLKSRYEKFWQPVNDLANKIVSFLFKAATFAFHWIPGLQATYMRPEFASPAVASPVVGAPIVGTSHHVPSSKPAAGYCYIKSSVPVDNGYFKYDYQD